MMNLAEYRKKPQSLADFLPWAALVASGVVLNKDGSLQRTARFRGPDLDSATPAELVGTSARLNNALRRLGSGWAIFVEASRDAAQTYPLSDFPDPVSALIERNVARSSKSKGFISRAPITSPSCSCRRPRRPPARRPSSMRADPGKGERTLTRSPRVSSTGRTESGS
jgi:hypothetical protein